MFRYGLPFLAMPTRHQIYDLVRKKRQAPARLRVCSPFTVVDLFSGAGGISEGFQQAGFDVLGGSDNDPDAAATYALNFPRASVITGDIRRPEVKEEILSLAKAANVLVGGPPCQAFSQVRNHTRMIDDPRNALYREFVDVVRTATPTAFVMENVTGMDQMGVREQIVADLALDGEYDVLPQVVDAADFGVPQTRKRLLFVGVKAGLGMRAPRLAGTGATEAVTLVRNARGARHRYDVVVQEKLLGRRISDALRDPSDPSVVTAADALSDLASLPVGNRSDEILVDQLAAPASAYQRLMRASAKRVLTNVQVPRLNRDTELRLRAIPRGGNHRDLSDALLDRYLTGQRWGQDNGTGRLSRRHFYAYRRLHPDIWAWTLNTKADSVYHYGHARALSVREFARLQSFPDGFVFTTDPRSGMIDGRHDGGPAHSRYRQVGNAVPPLLAKAVAAALLKEMDLVRTRDDYAYGSKVG
jgi:DNA (cytosine-5)-methyltransferase 1